MTNHTASTLILARARSMLAENRESEAVALLEGSPESATNDLHRQIATREATTALRRRENATATAWLDRGLRVSPADPVLNFFRGNLHQDSGDLAAAISCFRRCVAAQPDREEFVCNLGLALVAAGELSEACTVLAHLPGSASVQLNLGVARNKQGDTRSAIVAFESATRLQPELFAAWLNLGGAHDAQGDLADALAAYNRAVALQPRSARAHLERGHVLLRLKRFSEAVASFERTLVLEPANHEARLALVSARMRLCDWRDLPSLREETILPLLGALEGPELLTPFFLLRLPGGSTQEECRRVAESRARRIARDAVPARPRPRPPASRPLRIGYVSPDFGNHAVGNCLRSLFARHDRRRVSVHAFSLLEYPGDDFRAALRDGSDTWDDLDHEPDCAAVGRIVAREIDILVDLAGHTKSDRLRLFASRPAPVQVTWLGYPGTTGAPFIDYLLADEYLIPPAEEAAFSERIVRLPGSYLPTDDSIAPEGPESREANGLPAAGFVFCAFNNGYKIEPFIFDAWMEILRRTPGSWLWLRSSGPVADANLRREAGDRGIDPCRLLFDSRSLPRPEHLARHRAADLYLDTHFYNAHSTAADALRAGLPVLTLPGVSFPSRVGLSLVSTLGLADELVATSRDDYIERAVRIGTDPRRLASIRERLAAAVARPGGLFDTTAFARKLEDVFETLHGHASRGLAGS